MNVDKERVGFPAFNQHDHVCWKACKYHGHCGRRLCGMEPNVIWVMSKGVDTIFCALRQSLSSDVLLESAKTMPLEASPTWTSEQVWASIDMQGLGIAFKTLAKPQQQQTSKMMHSWWNTGHQRAKITKESYSGYPCCYQLDETTEHILR
jgi:hypothetical protein